MKKQMLIFILLPIFVVYIGCQILLSIIENPMITGIALAFQSAITILGVISIIYQMKRGHEINELDFFIKLKSSLLNDTQDMELLKKLQHQYECCEKDIQIENIEIIRYLAFFDSVYLALHKKVISLEILDETLSYYFFIAVHNEKIQDLELIKYAKYYKDIYLLYDIWFNYRKNNNKEIMNIENALSIKCEDYDTLVKIK